MNQMNSPPVGWHHIFFIGIIATEYEFKVDAINACGDCIEIPVVFRMLFNLRGAPASFSTSTSFMPIFKLPMPFMVTPTLVCDLVWSEIQSKKRKEKKKFHLYSTRFIVWMINSFNKDNFIYYCDLLAERDSDLKQIITTMAIPPFWSRSAEFATLVLYHPRATGFACFCKSCLLKTGSCSWKHNPEKCCS